MKLTNLEDSVGRIIDCPRGGRRRVRAVDKHYICYAVEIGGGTWMELSPTLRDGVYSCVEDDFMEGEIVEEINIAPTLPYVN